MSDHRHLVAVSSEDPPEAHEVLNLLRLVHSEFKIDLTEPQAHRVLRHWHEATRGLMISAPWPSQIGATAYGWLRARNGQLGRGIPGAEGLTERELVSTFSHSMILHLDHIDPDVTPQVGQHLVELDVNGQFLSASAIELGTGDPVHHTAPRSIIGYLGMPGYVRLATELQLDHPAFAGGVESGRTLAMTTAAWMIKHLGVEIPASEVLVWPEHRRHLALWCELMRDARTELTRRSAGGDRAAKMALNLVKIVANSTLGGRLRSQRQGRALFRRDWSDMIIAESWVRMLIALGRASRRPIGVRRDAAWIVGRPGDHTPQPDNRGGWEMHGLSLSTQLGKFKIQTEVLVTPEMVQAHADGSPERLIRLIRAAAR